MKNVQELNLEMERVKGDIRLIRQSIEIIGTHIAEYMDKDSINRNVAITFACEESKYQNATLFRSSI